MRDDDDATVPDGIMTSDEMRPYLERAERAFPVDWLRVRLFDLEDEEDAKRLALDYVRTLGGVWLHCGVDHASIKWHMCALVRAFEEEWKEARAGHPLVVKH